MTEALETLFKIQIKGDGTLDEKDLFRTAVFGGYQKEDVTDYIRSLENENETIRILSNREKNDLRTQLEQEKALAEELKTSLAALHEQIALLEQTGTKAESTPAPGEPQPPSDAAGAEKKAAALSDETLAQQNRLLTEQQLLAEKLMQMQKEMQAQWQTALEQLRHSQEEIQKRLEHEPAPAPLVSSAPPISEASPEASPNAPSDVSPDSSPRAGFPEETLPKGAAWDDPDPEDMFLWEGIPEDADETEFAPDPESTLSQYAKKADAAISKTQKNIEDLLLKLDRF